MGRLRSDRWGELGEDRLPLGFGVDRRQEVATGSSDANNPDRPVGKKFSLSRTDKAMVGSVFVTRALRVGTDVT
jgi:hypothetical protein